MKRCVREAVSGRGAQALVRILFLGRFSFPLIAHRSPQSETAGLRPVKVQGIAARRGFGRTPIDNDLHRTNRERCGRLAVPATPVGCSASVERRDLPVSGSLVNVLGEVVGVSGVSPPDRSASGHAAPMRPFKSAGARHVVDAGAEHVDFGEFGPATVCAFRPPPMRYVSKL